MKAIASVLALAAVSNLSLASVNDDALNDKLRGMFLLGAYADHTGFLVEGTNSVRSLVPDRLLDPNRINEENPFNESIENIGTYEWSKWFSESVVSDDTSYLHHVLVPYAEWVRSNGVSYNDESFGRYLVEQDKKIRSGEHGFFNEPNFRIQQESYYYQILDWISMLNKSLCENDEGTCYWDGYDSQYTPTAFERGTIEFYEKHKPVCFGIFMFLPLAMIQVENTISEAYTFFRNLTSLDQGYSKTVTGIFGALLSRALSVDASRQDFRTWYKDQLEKILTAIPAEDLNGFPISYLEESGVDRYYQPTNLPDETKRLLMIGSRKTGIKHCLWNTDPEADFTTKSIQPFKFDPAEFLCTINMIVRFSPETSDSEYSIDRAHQFVVSTGGDTDTIGYILGLLEGAYYGRAGILESVSPETRETLVALEQNLKSIDSIDVSRSASVIQGIR